MRAEQIPVPITLEELASRWRSRGRPPQPAVPWSRSSWLRQFPEHAEFLSVLPEQIDRSTATDYARHATTPNGAVQAFIVAMIWSHGPAGYGAYRTARVLRENAAAAERLAEIARIARGSGGLAAFEHIAANPLRYLGVAFGTKFLRFCTAVDGEDLTVPALDAVVRRWLVIHTGIRLTIDWWCVADYRSYLNVLAAWSTQLELPPDTVEELIFRTAVSDDGAALSGETWAAAGETVEPADLRSTIAAAVQVIEGTFAAMSGDAAARAEPHLRALRQLVFHDERPSYRPTG